MAMYVSVTEMYVYTRIHKCRIITERNYQHGCFILNEKDELTNFPQWLIIWND